MIDRSKHFRSALFALSAAAFVTNASATLEMFNWPFLISDESGRCYVRSVPKTGGGSAGKTTVYRVRSGEDELVHSFDWYSTRIAIKCGNIGPHGKDSISLVILGRSGRMALWLDGHLLAEYSSMDLALVLEDRGGYPRGTGHGYTKTLGFHDLDSRQVFEICTADGRILTFDIFNGDLIDQRIDTVDRCEQRNSSYFQSLQRITTTYY